MLKETSITIKLRVVFDASTKTTSGISLNDALMVGPVMQQNLFSILLRFRSFKYAVVADITKMYRQILLDTKQTALQHIVWRNTPQDIKIYELQTVTYGLGSASFLATRVLHELALLGENHFPKVLSMITRRDFYMDDLISGANSLQEALDICQQTALLLKAPG